MAGSITAASIIISENVEPPAVQAGGSLRLRLSTPDDLPALRLLMRQAINLLQRGFLSEAQIVASHSLMGLDTQLITDGTYFVVERDDAIAGCGGWSRRATLYGGDHSANRNAALLDPATEPARLRAMYTAPGHVRCGVGRRIVQRCEHAALREGFSSMQMAATLAGTPLYLACGYMPVEEFSDCTGGVAVPLVRMQKTLCLERRS